MINENPQIFRLSLFDPYVEVNVQKFPSVLEKRGCIDNTWMEN